jgi:hypothetical protein
MASNTEHGLKRAVETLSPHIDPVHTMMSLALYDNPKDRHKAIKPLPDDPRYPQGQRENPENSASGLAAIFGESQIEAHVACAFRDGTQGTGTVAGVTEAPPGDSLASPPSAASMAAQSSRQDPRRWRGDAEGPGTPDRRGVAHGEAGMAERPWACPSGPAGVGRCAIGEEAFLPGRTMGAFGQWRQVRVLPLQFSQKGVCRAGGAGVPEAGHGSMPSVPCRCAPGRLRRMRQKNPPRGEETP